MAQADDSGTLSQNQAFDILSNARRRFVLHYLSRRSGPIELRELADELGRWETGSDSLSRQERKRVYVSLYQTHIPRLTEAGIIEYDADAGTVQLVDRARDIDQFIGSPRDGHRWPLYYFSVAAVGTALYVLTSLGVVTSISAVMVGGLVVLSLLGLSFVHLLVTRYRREDPISGDQFIDQDDV